MISPEDRIAKGKQTAAYQELLNLLISNLENSVYLLDINGYKQEVVEAVKLEASTSGWTITSGDHGVMIGCIEEFHPHLYFEFPTIR